MTEACSPVLVGMQCVDLLYHFSRQSTPNVAHLEQPHQVGLFLNRADTPCRSALAWMMVTQMELSAIRSNKYVAILQANRCQGHRRT